MSSISISTFQIPDWRHGGSTAKLRLYASKTFTDSLGVPHLAGTVGSRNGFYQEINLTISGSTVTVPTFTTYSTTDARPGGETTAITGVLFDSKGGKRELLFSGWRIPETPAAMTWATLETFNQANPRINNPENVLSDVETIALIQSIAGVSLSDASDVIKGRTKLSVAPVSASNPIAVGDNDPRIGTNLLRATQTLGAVEANDGVEWIFNNPNATTGNDTREAISITRNTGGDLANPGFTDEHVISLIGNSAGGQNDNDGNSKRTFFNIRWDSTHYGWGQRFNQGGFMYAYGWGDAFARADHIRVLGGINDNGGEGVGLETSTVEQHAQIFTDTVLAVSRPVFSTTITPAITRSVTPQTVAVGSTAGITAGDWAIVAHGQWMLTDGEQEAVEITAVGVGTITAKFLHNHGAGATLTPATILTVASAYGAGLGVPVVNLSGASYSTGTAHGSAGGNTATGVGTTWANNMVGGDANNPGAISFVNDNESNIPFTALSPLKAWYPIATVSSTTSLAIPVRSQAGNTGYFGRQVAAAGYVIRPCARILNYKNKVATLTNVLVLDTNSFTWNVGDTIEYTHSTQFDIQGSRVGLNFYMPGGTYRSGYSISNGGLQTFVTAYETKNFNGNYTWAFGPRTFADAAISSGAAVLTSPALAQFIPSDVTAYVTVIGAGVAGQDLYAKIISWQSATQVTLDTNAGTTVAGATARVWRVPFQAAYSVTGGAGTGLSIDQTASDSILIGSQTLGARASIKFEATTTRLEAHIPTGTFSIGPWASSAGGTGGIVGVIKGISSADFGVNSQPALQIGLHLLLRDSSNTNMPRIVFQRGSNTVSLDLNNLNSATPATISAPSAAAGVNTQLALIPAGTSTTIGAGVGTINMSTAVAATNTAWIPVIVGGVTYWIPGFATNAP